MCANMAIAHTRMYQFGSIFLVVFGILQGFWGSDPEVMGTIETGLLIGHIATTNLIYGLVW